MKQAKEQICKECGCAFKPNREWQAFCSEKCCRAYHVKENRYKRLERRLESKKEPKRGKKLSLTDISVEARKAGMTYGEYVAKYGL